MTHDKVLPPGESPFDPWIKDIDPVAFALSRTRTYILWIEEHRASFEAARINDPEEAERELQNLADSSCKARIHIDRLVELLLAGYTINPEKRLPKNLMRIVEGRGVGDNAAIDEALDEAEDDIRNGRTFSNAEMKERAQRWRRGDDSK